MDLPPSLPAKPTPGVTRILPAELRGEKRYAIGEQIARGGMGAILDAREGPTKRHVAMKVMLDAASEDDVLRFVEEAQITAQLEHPNIVPIHELGVDAQGQPFYTMKLVRGITLQKVLGQLAEGDAATAKAYPLPALLTVFQKACDAVAFAHARGVIHRDLKPANIMLGDFGSVLVMDWGLAKMLKREDGERGRQGEGATECSFSPSPPLLVSPSRSALHTLAGTIMGSPQYMSPEQARGEVETLDARSDVFALGAILFEMLHHRPFVSGESTLEIIDKIAHEDFDWTPPKKAVPDSLMAVCRKALAFDREQRYPSVEALQRDLTAYQAGFATSAEKAGTWKQIALLIKRHRTATAGLAAVLIVGLTLGTKAILEGRRAEREGARAIAEGHRAEAEGRRAVAALEALRRQAPGLRELAETEAGLERFESALDKLEAALELEPTHLPSYWRRAWLLVGLERWAEAAAAVRLALEKDPQNSRQAAILPLLDRFSAMPTEADRWTPGAASDLFTHLRTVGAFAEIARLSAKLKLGKADQIALIRKRVDDWLGKGKGQVGLDEEGRLAFKPYKINEAVETVEPLRGLPLENLDLSTTRISNIEPLRGMPVQVLNLGSTKVADLSPLAGLPLVSLVLDHLAGVIDLAPLKGCPLQSLNLFRTHVRSLEPLRGMPLRILNLHETDVSDLTPLQGAPLQQLDLYGCGNLTNPAPLAGMPLKDLDLTYAKIDDLAFLKDAPLEMLRVTGGFHDLSPLSGKPLRFLILKSSRITDLSPLRHLPIEELWLYCENVHDFTPLLDLPKLEKIRILRANGRLLEPLRNHPALKSISNVPPATPQTAAEFWAAFDAQQNAAAPK